jgi:AcrR family transcriptional regulator
VSRRAVTTEQIVQAADRVARRDGLDQLTVRSLCAELGVTAPAVYRHFPTKDLIVDRVIDQIIERIVLPGPDEGDWVDRLRACYVSAHDEVGPYAGLAARMSHEMPKSPSARRNGAFLTRLLEEAGLDDADANKVIFAVFVYVWGHLLADNAARTGRGQMLSENESRQQFLWGLDHLLDSFRREFGSARRLGTRPKKDGTARRR